MVPKPKSFMFFLGLVGGYGLFIGFFGGSCSHEAGSCNACWLKMLKLDFGLHTFCFAQGDFEFMALLKGLCCICWGFFSKSNATPTIVPGC